MLCEDCNKNNATVHMTNIINGKKEEMHLCEECAKRRELSNFTNNFSIHNFLANLLEGNPTSNFNITYGQSARCSQCGSTYSDFKEGGLLGCNLCYATFKDKLLPLVKRIHGNSIHSGKIPKRAGGGIRLQKQVQTLKIQLQQLIEEEEFEEAAKLRDEIRRLEEQINNL